MNKIICSRPQTYFASNVVENSNLASQAVFLRVQRTPTTKALSIFVTAHYFPALNARSQNSLSIDESLQTELHGKHHHFSVLSARSLSTFLLTSFLFIYEGEVCNWAGWDKDFQPSFFFLSLFQA